MFDSVVLDVVIGLVFIYLLYSLMVTLIGEIVSSNINLRGLILRKSIRRMLNDSKEFKGSFAEKFYTTPSIKYLAANNIIKWPSYISADMFSSTVIGLLRKKKTASTIMEEIRIGVHCHDFKTAPETRNQLLHLIEEANGDLDEFKKGLESWYNETQDRATGWFKRRMQLVLFVIGFALSAIFNINSIKIADILTNNNEARYKVLAMASDSTTRTNVERIMKQEQKRKQEIFEKEEKLKQHVAYDSTPGKASVSSTDTTVIDTMAYHQYKQIAAYSEQVTDILGLGLEHAEVYELHFFGKTFKIYKHILPFNKDFFGILITALALSLGAPFWFGLLNKLLVLRGSGKNPDEEKGKQTTEEGKGPFKSISGNLQRDLNKHHLSEHVAKDPLLFAIAMNEQLWKKIPGVITVNKDYTLSVTPAGLHIKTPCIEVIHTPQANTASIPAVVSVDFQGAVHAIPVDKRPYGYAQPHFAAPAGTAAPSLSVCNDININALNGWGTITGIIQDSKTKTKLLLSCAHVLQGNNTNGAINGSSVISDGNKTTIGKLKYYLQTSMYDIAWAEVSNKAYLNGAFDIQKPRFVNSNDADVLLQVTMNGAISGMQTGRLWNVNASDVFNFPGGQVEMYNLIKITDISNTGARKTISTGGDSGALIRDMNGVPIAMVVGGNDEFTYAIKLYDIFNDYKNISPVT
jgi:hypothetical protein